MNTTKNTVHATAKKQTHGSSTSKEKSMHTPSKNASGKGAQNGMTDKTKDELLEIAKNLAITGRHDMTKDELIRAIGKHGKK